MTVSLNIIQTSTNYFLGKIGSKIELEMNMKSKSIKLKINRILIVVRCNSGPNLDILTLIPGEFSRRQTQNGVMFDFKVKFDLECECQSITKLVGTFSMLICIFYPNKVVLASTGDEFSPTHPALTHTDTRTDAGNDNTRRPNVAWGQKRMLHKK